MDVACSRSGGLYEWPRNRPVGRCYRNLQDFANPGKDPNSQHARPPEFPFGGARLQFPRDRMPPLTGRGGTPCLEPMRTPRGRTTCGDDQASRDRLRPAWSGRSGPTGGEPTSHAGFEPRVFAESGLAPDPSSLLDGGPAGGAFGRRLGIGTRDRSVESRHLGLPARDRNPRHPRYRSQTLSRLSGTTRTPATAVMKFRSPDQRGTMWAWRCWGRPAPAASP